MQERVFPGMGDRGNENPDDVRSNPRTLTRSERAKHLKVLLALVWYSNHNGRVPNGIELLDEMKIVTGKINPVALANALDLIGEAKRNGLLTCVDNYYQLEITEKGKRLVNSVVPA